MKTEITRSEYVQLAGLLALAKRHDQSMGDIEAAVADTLGDKEWASDAVRGGVADYDADALLRRIGVSVEARTDKERGE